MHRLPRALTLRQRAPSRLSHGPRIQNRKRSQIYHQATGEPMRQQSVRFKKPNFFTFRRVASFGIYTGVTIGYLIVIWRFFDIEIEFLDEEEIQELDSNQQGSEEAAGEGGGEGEGPFYAEAESLFIPLTWSRKLPRTFYRGTDEEWQEFIKVSKDKSRYLKVQNELVEIAYKGSVSHPSISRQLGKDATVAKFWLDISFPEGPPPEYERSGIEIGDGFIAWSSQKVTQENQWRQMRALWPAAAATSVWATVKVLAGIQYRRMKQALGWEGKDPFSPEERYRHAMEMMQKQQQARERKESGVGKAQMEPGGTHGTVVRGDSGTTPPSSPSAGAQSKQRNEDPKRIPWTVPVPIPKSPATSSTPSTDIPIAMHVFSATLSKQWNPERMEPPRGTFIVQGLVEVRGTRGRVILDVNGAYDPRQGKYVQVSAAVRQVKRWTQSPKGGR